MRTKTILLNGKNVNLKACVADNILNRALGWMGRKIVPKDALLIENCNSIHTFFMRFSIDAVFMDETGVIVRTAENIAPWRAVFPVRKARSVLELPKGRIKELSIGKGDKIGID